MEYDMSDENLLKVNLTLKGGNGVNGEGVWAEFATPEDKANYDDESRNGEVFKVKILNHPISTDDIKHSDTVEVINNGSDRPVLLNRATPSN